MPSFLDSAQAAERLGISLQTLYAYVSRGLIRPHSVDAGTRKSRYLEDDVERLSRRNRRSRKPKEAARAALDWGMPVLESAITLIESGRLYYRGIDACQLARQHSVEQVAALLWQFPEATAFTDRDPALPTAMVPDRAARHCEHRLLPLFALASDDAATAIWQTAPQRTAEGCASLLRVLAACLLGATPRTTPIHRQCAQAWQLDETGADLVRMALVLCADHELNASSFTARCVASTGASVRSAVIAGLAALSGGRHGGTTARVEALWDETGADPARRLRARLARGEDLPGFGHPLYPGGDVRASMLLERILPAHDSWRSLAAAAGELTGQPPSLDFALVALRRHLGLPPGSAFGLFALGRASGWIAHALEQRGSATPIRPRAAYTGARPV
ncbi:citrate synthase family protein [Paludibacterium yongneupense]|uniref:citrate synthase family protein n=1 Tax=Paludibacterium yongneupense TaxID=400061 RepID=UPI000408FF9F|nr:citrate synthase family protein [Paludibacterium yongneupense]